MKVTLKPRNPLSPNVQKYRDKFGRLPSMEVLKHLTSESVDSIAKEAVEEDEPIPEWRNRDGIETGTILDDFYGL